MNIFNDVMTLAGIEKQLDKLLLNDEIGIRVIGDIDLSNEDYKFLKLKMKELKKYKINIYEKYKLSIVTYLVFTLKKEESTKRHNTNIKLIRDLKQHQLRYFINMCNTVFEEYGIETFGYDIKSEDELYELLNLQTGKNEKSENIIHSFDRIFHVGKVKPYDKRMSESKFNTSNMNPVLVDEKKFVSPRTSEVLSYEAKTKEIEADTYNQETYDADIKQELEVV